jgi:hypothetical protein
LSLAFGVSRFAWGVWRTAFYVWRSSFRVWRFAFCVSRLAFGFWRSAFFAVRSFLWITENFCEGDSEGRWCFAFHVGSFPIPPGGQPKLFENCLSRPYLTDIQNLKFPLLFEGGVTRQQICEITWFMFCLVGVVGLIILKKILFRFLS